MRATEESTATILRHLARTLTVRETEELITMRTEEIKRFLQYVMFDRLDWVTKKRVTFLAERFRAYWLRKITPYSNLGSLEVKPLYQLRQARSDFQESLSALQPVNRWLKPEDLPRLRSQKIAMDALVAGKEGASKRDVAKLWAQAAKQCTYRNISQTTTKKNMQAFRALYLSNSHKFRGFDAAIGIGRSVEEATLAIRQMRWATNLAKRAHDLLPVTAYGDLRRGVFRHQEYLRYWLCVFRIRHAVLEGKWKAAKLAVKDALEAANNVPIFPADEFKPHYYLGIDDLDNERFLIDSMRLLRRKSFRPALENLEGWLKAGEVYFGTWRYASVEVRERVLHIVSKTLLGEAIEETECREIGILIRKWQLGASSKKLYQIVREAVHNWNKSRDVSVITRAVEAIQSHMPLDIWVEEDEEDDEEYRVNPLDYLPARLTQQLESCLQMLAVSQSPQHAALRLRQAVASYLAVTAEYWLYRASLADSYGQAEFREQLTRIVLDVAELVKLVKSSCPGSLRVLDILSQKVTDMLDDPTTARIEDALTYFRDEAIGETFMRCYPLIIEVLALERQVRRKDDLLRFYKARRVQKLSVGAPYIVVCGYEDLALHNFYYLPPWWKRMRYYGASYPLFRPEVRIYSAVTYKQLERYAYPWAGWEEWTDDLEKLLRGKEGPELEYKGPQESTLIKSIQGLANARGGHLVIGLSDEFNLKTGLRDIRGVTPKRAEQIWNGLVTANRHVEPHPILYEDFHKPVEGTRLSILIFYVHRAPPDQDQPYRIGRKVTFREGASTQTYHVEANADRIMHLWGQNRAT